jgi:S1-C subfamily serine protease
MSDTNMLAPLQSLSSACVGLVAKVATAMVSVNSRRWRSSGFVWRSGLIVTAEEALTGEDDIAITLASGDTLPAQIVGRDPTTDVALLRSSSANSTMREYGQAWDASLATDWVISMNERSPWQ